MSQAKSILAPLIAIVFLLSGCEQKVEEEIDFGVINNSVYENKHFGLTVALPSEWSIQDQEAQRRIMELGSKIVAADDKNLKAAVKASELTTVNLFAAFKHPIGTLVSFNPGIMCLAESIQHAPGIKRGKDYLLHTKRVLELSQMEVSFPQEISTEVVGGQQFDVMHTETTTAGVVVRQKYYAAVIKGYALVIITSFSTDLEEAALDGILETVAFK